MGTKEDRLTQVLEEELLGLADRENGLHAEAAKIAGALACVRKRRELVEALLGCTAPCKGAERGAITCATSGAQGTVSGGAAKPRPVADIAFDILRERGKEAIHYEELAALVGAAGGGLGGPNPAQALVARIAKDDRFVRPAKRGWYSLREFYPKTRSVGARKKSRRTVGPPR